MFLPSQGTPYDLRFALFGIPVTVSPFFWVTAMLLGFHWLRLEPGGPANLLAWVLCVFVSLILHEFGHALTMRAFGHRPEVVLHHFGGYATYRGRETAGRSLLITMAGPGAQLLLFAAMTIGAGLWLGIANPLILLTPRYLFGVPGGIAGAFVEVGRFEFNTPLYAIVESLLLINLLWPLFNLLPVLPLDGGRILASILELSHVRRAEMWTQRVGVVVGVLAAVYFLLIWSAFIAGAMFAFMAMANYQALQGEPMEGV